MKRLLFRLPVLLMLFCLISCQAKEVTEKVDYETPIRNALREAQLYDGEQPVAFCSHRLGENKAVCKLMCGVSSVRDHIETETETETEEDVEGTPYWQAVQRTRLRIDDYTSYDCEVLYDFYEGKLAKIDLLIRDQNNEGGVLYDIRKVFDEVYGEGMKYEDADGARMYFYFIGNVYVRVYVANNYDCVVEYLDSKSERAKFRELVHGSLYPFERTYSRTMRDFIRSVKK